MQIPLAIALHMGAHPIFKAGSLGEDVDFSTLGEILILETSRNQVNSIYTAIISTISLKKTNFWFLSQERFVKNPAENCPFRFFCLSWRRTSRERPGKVVRRCLKWHPALKCVILIIKALGWKGTIYVNSHQSALFQLFVSFTVSVKRIGSNGRNIHYYPDAPD